MTVAAAALLAAGAVSGWWWAKSRPLEPSVIAESKQPVPLYWYDPMHPQQHFDKPGKSPFMDMELVPRYSNETTKAAGLQVVPAVQQNLGMRLAKVERVDFSSKIDASGMLSLNERDVAVVQSRAAGFVEQVWPLAPGDLAEAGTPLAELVLPDWAAAQHEFLAIKASGDAGLLAAARERLRLLGIDEREIRRLESDGTAQSRFIVRAPIGGIVQELEVRAGMTVVAGQTLLRINGLGSVWLEVAVPESLASNVHVGDRAEVRLVGDGTAALEGGVSALLPVLNDVTRTLRVRIELPNRDGALRPGQSAQVSISAASQQSSLSVPTEAVIRTGKRSMVMLAEQGSFRPVEVKLGGEVADRTIIVDGLAEGQWVVASGQFLLDSEASLRGLGGPSTEDHR